MPSEIVLIAITRRGAALAAQLAESLGVDALLPAKFGAADAGNAGRSACYSGSVLGEIRRCWGRYRALVLIMASGVAVRSVAPLLGTKSSDPAVICLDEAGRWAIPLLGGHQVGANALAQRIAALTNGQAPITTASDSQGKPALDLLGRAQGWRIDNASALTHASACLVNDKPIGVWLDPELPMPSILGELLAQVDNATLVDSLDMLHGDAYAAGLIVSHRALALQHDALFQKSVVYRPPVLVVGMGCRRGVPLDELRAALDATLADAGLALASVAALATAQIKADEPGLRALADALGVPLRVVPHDDLAALDPSQFSPSAAQAQFGLPGVAEPCALLVAGGPLLLPKRTFARCTVAVALAGDRRPTTDDRRPTTDDDEPGSVVSRRRTTDDQRRTANDDEPGSVVSGQWSVVGGQRSVAGGRLSLIGIGPGDPQQITGAALAALRAAEVVVGYTFYIGQVRPLVGAGQELIASPIGDEVARAEQAIDLAATGRRVALISSGDIGIYAMAGPVFEALRQRGWQGDNPEIVVLPGISAMQAVSARLGAALAHDFCAISLSDLLTPWPAIERRLWAAARGDFVVALYNPRSRERDWQLGRALEILRTYRPASTPVAVARNATRPDETIALTTIADIDPASVDMFTLVLIGSSQSYVVGGRMATPRGYTDEGRASESISGRLTRRREGTKDELTHVVEAQAPAALYPITLTQLRGAPVLVVGGGAVGERKVRGLLAAGAAVRLISPDATAGLSALARGGAIDWQARAYRADDLPVAGPLPRLVFAATSERATNAQIARDAEALGLLCNVADDPGASTFHLPAVHRGHGLTLAVSTAGESPARAAQVRDALAAFLEQQTGEPL